MFDRVRERSIVKKGKKTQRNRRVTTEGDGSFHMHSERMIQANL